MKEDRFQMVISEENLMRAWTIVRSKDSAGGIDGVTLEEYAMDIENNISVLRFSLSQGKWKPEPYLNKPIPKKNDGVRMIGLMAVEDKIVQTAIKNIIEPLLESTFFNSSFAYRPGRGHLRCVKQALSFCRKHKSGFWVRCDIDDFFATIDRGILFGRLRSLLVDERLMSLIELCLSIGSVDEGFKWNDSDMGLPQGTILSPILANYYLSPFDQSVLSKTQSYLRYSDDFVFWCDDLDSAERLADNIVSFLSERLRLHLNEPPVAKSMDEAIPFLGLLISPSGTSLSAERIAELTGMVCKLEWNGKELSKHYWRNIDGIRRYYLAALPGEYRKLFSKILGDASIEWKETGVRVDEKIIREIGLRLVGTDISDTISMDDGCTPFDVTMKERSNRKKAMASRKLEYHRLEAENSELVISSSGYYIGAGGRGLIVRKNGQPIRIHSAAVKHISIMSGGVSFSSNLIEYCANNGIGLDFFGDHCTHNASLLAPEYMQTNMWDVQKSLSEDESFKIAKAIMIGKLRNQLNLCKYFNKYHKHHGTAMAFASFNESFSKVVDQMKRLPCEGDYKKKLMAYEALAAELYWEYVRELLYDDDVEFYSRVKQGARDVFNCMLNYGYALLYPRIWQSLLRRGFNPYIGLVHHAEGNANLVFDFIELFRCQAVDRIVIGIIQKKEKCSVTSEGLLDEPTKKRLTEELFKRLYRYENYRGEHRTLSDIIDLQVAELVRSYKNGNAFRPYLAKW